jgi:hypothetical protein
MVRILRVSATFRRSLERVGPQGGSSLFASLVAVLALTSSLIACKSPDTSSIGPSPKSESSKGKKDEGTKKDSTKKSTGFDDLRVTVDGKRMSIEHAFVKRRPDASLLLYMGEGGSCRELLDDLFDGKAKHLLVDLPQRLAPDGKESYDVTDVYLGPQTDADKGGTATVQGPLTQGSTVTIALSFTAKGGKDEKLAVEGSLGAESCGDEDTSKNLPLKAKHPSTATMTIAGKTFPIVGAIRSTAGIVELTDFPRDCVSAGFIGARLSWSGGLWQLDGSRIAETDGALEAGLKMKIGKHGTSPDGDTVSLTLSGSQKLERYTVAIDGTVEALDCPM